MKNKNLYAVILAGGSGTRFWPMSRKLKPKQFLNITGEMTLFQETLKRILPMVFAENIFIVTGKIYQKKVFQQTRLFKIPAKNFLLEPQGKNTAPAICWAASKIYKMNPQAVMAVFPSDHLILNEKRFLHVLQKAVNLARKNYLVTLGIVPTRPETGYGYLKTVQEKEMLRVEKFIEKPSLSKARKFLENKNYFWNSGMFIWKAETILENFCQYLPKVYELLTQNSSQIQKVWPQLPSISVDYAILEKAKNVAAVAVSDIGWSDLGSWQSLTKILTPDKHGNIFKSQNVINLDCKDTFVWGEKRLISVIGLEGLCVIDTPDALLVCRKEASQRVKEILSQPSFPPVFL